MIYYVEKNINSYKNCVFNLYIIFYKTKLYAILQMIMRTNAANFIWFIRHTVRVYKNNIYEFILHSVGILEIRD